MPIFLDNQSNPQIQLDERSSFDRRETYPVFLLRWFPWALDYTGQP